MIIDKLNENEYQVSVYDWIDSHDDYVCGHIKRQPDVDEDSDLRYWMFYPIGVAKPLMVRDLKSIYEFMSKKNLT